MKVLVLVLALAATVRCDDTAPSTLAANATVPLAANSGDVAPARELKSVGLAQFATNLRPLRRNDDGVPPDDTIVVEDNTVVEEEPVEEGEPVVEEGEGEGEEAQGEGEGEVTVEVEGGEEGAEATVGFAELSEDQQQEIIQGVVAQLKACAEAGEAECEFEVDVVDDLLEVFMFAYDVATQEPPVDRPEEGADDLEGQLVDSGTDTVVNAAEVTANGGYEDEEEEEGSGVTQSYGATDFDPEAAGTADKAAALNSEEVYKRNVRRNAGVFRVAGQTGLFRRNAAVLAGRTAQRLHSWPGRRQSSVASPLVKSNYRSYQAFRNRRWLDMAYAGNGATYKNIPDLLNFVSGAATMYNAIFSPLPNNGTNPPSGLQQAVYYLQLYATIRNFAISFAQNRAGIENNLNQVLNNATAVGFTKNEMLAFYGYLDLVNSLKLSTEAFSAPFIAQDQRVNLLLTNFTNTLKAIVQDVNFLKDQDEEVSKATNGLTSTDPSVSNPTLANMQRVDATLLLLPNLITIYVNIQNSITDLQAQLDNLKRIRVELQTIIGNMQLIVNGKADQVPNAAPAALFATACMALLAAHLG